MKCQKLFRWASLNRKYSIGIICLQLSLLWIYHCFVLLLHLDRETNASHYTGGNTSGCHRRQDLLLTIFKSALFALMFQSRSHWLCGKHLCHRLELRKDFLEKPSSRQIDLKQLRTKLSINQCMLRNWDTVVRPRWTRASTTWMDADFVWNGLTKQSPLRLVVLKCWTVPPQRWVRSPKKLQIVFRNA